MRTPHPLFDPKYYLANNPDVAPGVDPFLHFLRYGASEGRKPNPFFDTSYYLDQNPDVASASINPLIHYLEHGAREGRDPSPFFDTDWYLSEYKDVAVTHQNPLIHYLYFGAAQGRRPNPIMETKGFLDNHPDATSGEVDLREGKIYWDPSVNSGLTHVAGAPFSHHARQAPKAFLGGFRTSEEFASRLVNESQDGSSKSASDERSTQESLKLSTLLQIEFDFTIERHLTSDESGHLISVGNDPILYLTPKQSRMPRGWVFIEIETELIEGSSLSPSIYVDSGQGFNAGEHIRLAAPIDGYIRHVVELPQTLNALRFDPAETPCKFRLGTISFQEIDGFDAATRLMALLYESVRDDQIAFQQLLDSAGAIYANRSWPGLKKWLIDKTTQTQQATQYTRWAVEYDTWSSSDIRKLENEAATLTFRPKFSIVMPTYNTAEEWLRAAIESVIAQAYPEWELCICDDASTQTHVRQLLDHYKQADPRIKTCFRNENGHISRATNDAMKLISGEYMCLMDHDDEIAPNALLEFARTLNEDRTVDFIYSDEDKISINGVRYDPFFKPDWSPELLETCMYTAHFACYDMRIVKKIGGFRPECNGAQDYDFALRYTELVSNVRHIPKVLYHWRAIPGSTALAMESKDYVIHAAVRALEDRMARTGNTGKVVPHKFKGAFEFRQDVVGRPLVSIVIPSAGRDAQIKGRTVDLLVNCVQSIHDKSTYRNFEIVVVDNGDLRAETKHALQKFDIKFVTYREVEFNVAKKMNMGAGLTRGDYLLFLNDDVEVISADWLECMIAVAQRPGVGLVGAKLLFEDDTLQHIGVTFCEGFPDHIRRGFPADDPGYFFSSVGMKNYLAVTGACLMIRPNLFWEVGGFEEQFAINYNDIDLCLKVIRRGERVVYCPLAQLYHFESKSRARTVAQNELDLFSERWFDFVRRDPYYGANLTLKPPTFELEFDFPKRLRSVA